MADVPTCTECGRLLPEGLLAGFCPVCSLQSALNLSATAEPQTPLASTASESSANSSDSQGLPCFGDYELLELLARGGMGVIYRARQASLNRIVAVKMIQAGVLAGPAEIKRFHAEAEAIAQLHHPNIVAIHEIGVHDGQHFFSMDYVAGRTLAEIVRDGPLPAARAAAYVRTIAEAVHYAHEHGIIHRDLKPANVIIDKQDQPRVTDFGLAKRLPDSQISSLGSELTLSGQVLGSPNFMAPEQAEGRSEAVSASSDVYSLGALLYCLLTRQPPFQAETLSVLLQQVRKVQPVRPGLLNPSVPRDLETICLKCLEKEPERRYHSAQLLADDLKRFLKGEPIRARPVGPPGRVWRWCRRHPVRSVAIAVFALVVGSAAAAVLWQWRQTEAARIRAEAAERNLTERLWNSYLAEARADRWSGRAGRRFDGLEAIRKAAAIRPSLQLRNEAIACLALPDMRIQRYLRVDAPERIVWTAVDGQFERYACLYEDSSISLRRVTDDTEVMRLVPAGNPGGGVLRFSDGGQFLSQATAGGFLIWDLTRRQVAFSLAAFRNIAFAPGDREMAGIEENGTVHFYDLPSGTELSKMTVPSNLISAAYDPAGKRLAISRERAPEVVVVDIASKATCGTISGIGRVRNLSWSRDGQALVCPSENTRIYLCDVGSGNRKSLEGHFAHCMEAFFAHSGTLLVSYGWDGMIRLWDPNLPASLVSMPGGVCREGFSSDDRRLAFWQGPQQGILEVAPAQECRRLGRTDVVWGAQFSPNGRMLATASADGIRLWQPEVNRLLKHLQGDRARSAIWAEDGTKLVTAGGFGVQCWSFKAPESAILKSELPEIIWRQGRDGVCASPDGRTLIAGGADQGDVVVLDLQGGAVPRSIVGHPRASCVSISPNGKWFATGTWHGNGVKIWSTESWSLANDLPVPDSSGCAFSPDGAWLITGSTQEYAVWTTNAWRRVAIIPRDRAGDMPGDISFSPDGRMMALLHGRHLLVKLVSVPEWKELATLDTGRPLCFSPDSSQLATTSEDHRSLFLWDLRLIRQELRGMGLDWE